MQYKPSFMGCLGMRENCHGRRATTLIELVVVVALVSLLLAVVGTLAVHLRQWDHQVRDHSQHIYELAILAEAIRADFRSAITVTVPEKSVLVISGANNHEVRYELQHGGCRRVVKSPVETSPKMETFSIGPADSWKIEKAAPGRRPAYSILLDRSEADKAVSRSVPFFVYAAAGGDMP